MGAFWKFCAGNREEFSLAVDRGLVDRRLSATVDRALVPAGSPAEVDAGRKHCFLPVFSSYLTAALNDVNPLDVSVPGTNSLLQQVPALL